MKELVRSKIFAKTVMGLAVFGLIVGNLITVYAAVQSKSIGQLKDMSEKQWLSLIGQGNTTITYGDKPVATLVPFKNTNPDPTPVPPSTKNYPSDVLNLSNWYLGLPVDTPHDGNPDNIYQPELTGYEQKPFFFLNSTKDGVVFAANAGGAHTSGSDYPRSELRERNGNAMASWTNKSGTHIMDIRQAITKVTPIKPHVVAGQIHDSNDDVIQIRLEGKELMVRYNDGKNKITLDTNYQLATIFDLKIVAANSHIKISYNGIQKADIAKSGSGWYFKAGCYTQSNVSKGDKADAFAEVVIYKLLVEHK